MSKAITTAEIKIVRELANISACDGETCTAIQIATGALGEDRWDDLDGPSIRDAIRAVDSGRRTARWWSPVLAEVG